MLNQRSYIPTTKVKHYWETEKERDGERKKINEKKKKKRKRKKKEEEEEEEIRRERLKKRSQEKKKKQSTKCYAKQQLNQYLTANSFEVCAFQQHTAYIEQDNGCAFCIPSPYNVEGFVPGKHQSKT